ncbi:hypothetical protein PGT21_019738 [Puccinia graminis f. sp. tritici]|uniref:Uncharacterized protein n=1 Tax=Puccinia graminis f. sp. tritici TaxID=56615 RepID=A0A5B0MDS0_PUCGR|nr:hypothetical protein PGT21_019738 [Puccinia graminis f. sp. tritici]
MRLAPIWWTCLELYSKSLPTKVNDSELIKSALRVPLPTDSDSTWLEITNLNSKPNSISLQNLILTVITPSPATSSIASSSLFSSNLHSLSYPQSALSSSFPLSEPYLHLPLSYTLHSPTTSFDLVDFPFLLLVDLRLFNLRPLHPIIIDWITPESTLVRK